MMTKANTSIFSSSVRYCSESIITFLYSSFSSNRCHLLIVAVQKYISPLSIYDFRLPSNKDLSIFIKLQEISNAVMPALHSQSLHASLLDRSGAWRHAPGHSLRH